MEYHSENFGGTYDFRSRKHQGWQIGTHLHEYSEILYCTEGAGSATVGGQPISVMAGQFIWIPPNYIHSYDFSSAEVVCAVFSNDFVPLFFRASEGRRFCVCALDAGDLAPILEKLYQMKREDYLNLCGYLHLIGARVIENAKFTEGKQTDGLLYQKVISYLSEHYAENITLSSVAKTFGYNEKYLSHTLHALTQMHFSHLLSLYRIQAAKRLLEGAERKNITEIATACGFGAINTFHRAFKESVGVTPSEYKRKFLKM